MSLSRAVYTADGTNKQFDIPFDYLTDEHVKVTVYDLDGLSNPIAAAFSFVTPTRVELNAAPASGKKVRVWRDVPVNAPYVDFVDGAELSEQNLDNNSKALLHVAQRAIDDSTDAVEKILNIDAAVEAAQAARAGAEGFADAASTKADEAATSAQQAASSVASAAAIAGSAAQIAGNVTAAANSAQAAHDSELAAAARAAEALDSKGVAQTSATAAAASATQAAQSAVGGDRVKGLVGNVNATTPLTRFDLSAALVALADVNGSTIVRKNTATLTCNLATAGPAANGRDQASAFPANSWLHLYFIWNPTTSTLATLASLTAPTAFIGSTLPSGYTHWAYATTLRWNASSNIVPVLVRGGLAAYSATQNLLTNGGATTETALSLTTFVPSVAAEYTLMARLGMQAPAGGGALVSMGIRAVSGSDYMPLDVTTTVAAGSAINTTTLSVPNTGTLYYQINPGASASRGADFSIMGYRVPNGDT